METLTVEELIDQLSMFPQDLPVVACANYGDRKRTMQAISLNTLQSSVYLKESGYSESGYKVVEEYSDDFGEVVLLNYDNL